MKEKYPASIEVERAVLGIALTGGMEEVCASIERADFSLERHQTIWKCCEEIRAAGHPVDQVTVVSALSALGLYEAGYVVQLTEGAMAAHLPGYVQVLKEHTRRRRVLLAAQSLSDGVMAGDPVEVSLERFAGSCGSAAASTGQE